MLIEWGWYDIVGCASTCALVTMILMRLSLYVSIKNEQRDSQAKPTAKPQQQGSSHLCSGAAESASASAPLAPSSPSLPTLTPAHPPSQSAPLSATLPASTHVPARPTVSQPVRGIVFLKFHGWIGRRGWRTVHCRLSGNGADARLVFTEVQQ